MQLQAERRVIDTVLAAGVNRSAAPISIEPPPEEAPGVDDMPGEPYGGGLDWIRPVPKVPIPPVEARCKCELEVLPDISQGAFTGVFRLSG
ncbi:MAG: hypothetical protein KDB90_16585, partial [Planctomycetes bacterium]|nr:hypothetical protein [Planctomycetota bacterium]